MPACTETARVGERVLAQAWVLDCSASGTHAGQSSTQKLLSLWHARWVLSGY